MIRDINMEPTHVKLSLPSPRPWLEFFLLRSYTRRKVPKNLRIKVRRVASEWEVPGISLFPRSCRLPQTVAHLESRSSLSRSQHTFLTTLFGDFRIAADLDGLGYARGFPALGFVWEARFPQCAVLGKRRLDSDSGFGSREHSLTFSHLGVKSHIPSGPELSKCLEKIAGGMADLGGLLVHHHNYNFRVRLDDVLHMFELRFSREDLQTPEVKEVYHFPGSTLQTDSERLDSDGDSIHDSWDDETWPPVPLPTGYCYQSLDDPDISICSYVSQLVSGSKEAIEDGPFSLLNTIIDSVSYWVEIHRLSGIVAEDQDLEELITPFVSLLRWSQPINYLLFRRLVQHFHPGALAEKCKQAILGEPWQSGMQWFLRAEALESALDEVRVSRNLQSLRTFWLDHTYYAFNSYRFPSKEIMKIISQASQQPWVRQQLISSLEREVIGYRKINQIAVGCETNTAKLEVSEQVRRKLFTHTLNPLCWLTNPSSIFELMSITKQNAIVTKTLDGREKPLDNLDPAHSFTSRSLLEAVRYKQITILLLRGEEISENISELKLIIVDLNGDMKLHRYTIDHRFFADPDYDKSFYAPRDLLDYDGSLVCNRESQLHLWDQGKLVSMNQVYHLSEDYEDPMFHSITILDCRECNNNPSVAPDLQHLKFEFSEFGMNNPEFSFSNETWTVAFGSIFFFIYQQSALPTLFSSELSGHAKRKPHCIGWEHFLSPTELTDLKDSKRLHGEKMHKNLIAAKHSKVLFLLLFDRSGTPTKARGIDSEQALFVLCFKSNHKSHISSHESIRFVAKETFGVPALPKGETEQLKPLISKVIHVSGHDFLLLKVGIRPVQIFTMRRNRIAVVAINGKATAHLPQLPGRIVGLPGLMATDYMPYSAHGRMDRLSGKTYLQIFTLDFSI